MRSATAIVTLLAMTWCSAVPTAVCAPAQPSGRSPQLLLDRWWAPATHAVAFSADGRLLASGSDDGLVRLWDPRAGRLRGVLTGSRHSVGAVAFSPNGRVLAAGGQDLAIRLWDARTDALLSVTGDAGGHIHSLAFTPDGARVIAGTDGSSSDGRTPGSIRVWAVRTGRLVGGVPLPHRDDPLAADSVALSPDGRYLAAGLNDGSLHVWRFPSGRLAWSEPWSGTLVLGVAFSPDSRVLAYEAVRLERFDDGEVSGQREVGRALELRRAHDGRLIRAIAGLPARSRQSPAQLTYSSDGRTLAVGGQLWAPRTGRLRLRLPQQDVTSVAFSRGGDLLATGGGNGKTHVWDARIGRLLATFIAWPTEVHPLTHAPNKAPDWLAFTPEGYFEGTPEAIRRIRWRVGDRVFPSERFAGEQHRPEALRRALASARSARRPRRTR